MENWFTYILECSDKTLYIGVTNDLDKRLEKHNTGKGAKYTRGRAPVKLLYSQPFASKSDACKEEYRLKKLTREEKLALIKSVIPI
jgi:putative endonuclease